MADPESVFQELLEGDRLIRIKLSTTRTAFVQRERFNQIADRVIKSLDRLHQQYPLRFSHSLQLLEVEFGYLDYPELLKSVVAQLSQDNKVSIRNGAIGLVGYGPKLSKGEHALMEQLIRDLQQHGMKPPNPKELQATAKKNRESVKQLLDLAAENGDLTKVNEDIYLHTGAHTAIQDKVRTAIQEKDGLPMSDIRQIMDTSRKYAVPICEYWDAIGFTRREGDVRVLGGGNQEVASDE